MKKFIAAIVVSAFLATPAFARKLTAPANDAVFVVTIPDKWKTKEIEYGYQAKSPDNDIFFSIEASSEKNKDAFKKANAEWMKENGIDMGVAPKQASMDFNGVTGNVLRFETKDENGPTVVEFVILPTGKKSMVMIKLWGSEAERKANEADINAIMGSIKPIE